MYLSFIFYPILYIINQCLFIDLFVHSSNVHGSKSMKVITFTPPPPPPPMYLIVCVILIYMMLQIKTSLANDDNCTYQTAYGSSCH